MYGVWESGRFVGAIVYAWGSNQNLSKTYDLKMTECAELCRVALKVGHNTPTSQVVAYTIKTLKATNPGLRLLVSYADCDQHHTGAIYQATNWIYTGLTQTNGGTPKYRIHGKVLHGRQVYSLYGRGAQRLDWLRANVDPNAEHVFTLGKHKYLYPLDKAMRQQIAPLAQPYPKRASEVTPGDTASDQDAKGGSSPTRTLNKLTL